MVMEWVGDMAMDMKRGLLEWEWGTEGREVGSCMEVEVALVSIMASAKEVGMEWEDIKEATTNLRILLNAAFKRSK